MAKDLDPLAEDERWILDVEINVGHPIFSHPLIPTLGLDALFLKSSTVLLTTKRIGLKRLRSLRVELLASVRLIKQGHFLGEHFLRIRWPDGKRQDLVFGFGGRREADVTAMALRGEIENALLNQASNDARAPVTPRWRVIVAYGGALGSILLPVGYFGARFTVGRVAASFKILAWTAAIMMIVAAISLLYVTFSTDAFDTPD